MNRFEAAFDRLHACQTRTLGIDIRATLTGYCANAKAILGSVRDDDVAVEGGIGQRGGYEVQIKASDFSSPPAHDTQCTLNGAATGQTLVLTSFEHRGGVYLLIIGDPAFA